MTIANRYFEDLKDLVLSPGDEGLYDIFLKHLMSAKFISLVPYDGNRVDDVQDLRGSMVENTSYLEDFNTIFGVASVFEILYILARQMEFIVDEAEWDVKRFFWLLCCNVTGAETKEEIQNLDDVDVIWALKRFVKREYNSDGTNGGAFPLPKTRKNLRRMELWYQMQEYIIKKRFI